MASFIIEFRSGISFVPIFSQIDNQYHQGNTLRLRAFLKFHVCQIIQSTSKNHCSMFLIERLYTSDNCISVVFCCWLPNFLGSTPVVPFTKAKKNPQRLGFIIIYILEYSLIRFKYYK